MAARRCSLCGLNYPVRQELTMCQVCGESTSYLMNATPDEDWEEQVRRRNNPAVFSSTAEKVELYRLGRLVETSSRLMGVLDENDIDALERMARSESDLHVMLDALEAGCTLGLALGIFE